MHINIRLIYNSMILDEYCTLQGTFYHQVKGKVEDGSVISFRVLVWHFMLMLSIGEEGEDRRP